MTKVINMRRLTISGKTRNLTYGNERTYFPIIKLEGVWLQDAGFLPGQKVYLFIEDGKITLKSQPETELESKAMKVYNVFNTPKK
jgi:hypothetical protein